VRVGEFILLVDADTRVPPDCILPTVSELLRAPAVGYTQHFTLPLQACACIASPLL
jgi:cellulose synthase/poly-beta-1,6-N-acetylglucosamine synthase-like glycosyltransferase